MNYDLKCEMARTKMANKPSKALAFVDAICRKTMQGGLRWEKTAKTHVFQSAVGKFIVLFSVEEKDQDPDSIYVIRLLDSEGELIERLTDETFETAQLARNEGSLFKRMKAAYEKVRYEVMGVEKALNSVLEELGESGE